MPLISRRAVLLLFVSAIPLIGTFLYLNVSPHGSLAGLRSRWLPATKAQSFCIPPGPLVPQPRVLPSSSKFETPKSLFKRLPWYSDTSYAVKASIGNITVLEHEFSAPGRAVGQPLLDTSLRIGSLTKVFTMMAVLLSADSISLTDSITKFVPQLDKDVYRDVTIASLASHTSGLGRYVYVGDLAVIPDFKPTVLGLPDIESTGSRAPHCDTFPGGRICTREEMFSGLNDPAYYLHSTHSGPLYSNIGFTLLGLALEAVHNKTAERVIHDLIISPLGLNKTTFLVPTNASEALLPRSPADRGWFVPDFGNYNPSGGLWSTSNDILLFLQSILMHKLLGQRETRRWLQPRALLPSLHQAVGESWEILRPTDLNIKTPRPIDVFTKTGGVTGYAAYTAIIPEYDIAITINAAGSQANDAVLTLFPQMVKSLVAYTDKLVQEQMAMEYAGSYTADGTKEILNLEADDGPGLAITKLTLNGVSVLHSLAAMQKVPYEIFTARLYPSDADTLMSEREVWKIGLDRTDRTKQFAELQCASWNWGDAFRYVKEPLDTVIFTRRADGTVGLELLGWRVKLQRSSGSRV